MRRSTRLLVALAAAILTYASLMAFAGPQYRSRHGLYSYHAHGHHNRHHCGKYGSWKKDHSGRSPGQESPPAETPGENQ